MPNVRKCYNRWGVQYCVDNKKLYKSFSIKSDAEQFAALIEQQKRKKRKAKYDAVHTAERKLKRQKNLKILGNNNACESEAIRLLYPILTESNYEVQRVRDGAKADLCVRKEGEELFYGVQIKSCLKRCGRSGRAMFSQTLGYDMPVVCVCNDTGELWVFRGEELTINKIYIGRTSKHDVHKVTTDTLGNTLHTMLSHYTPHEQIYWDTYGLGITQLKEHIISLQADTIREIDGKPFRIRRSTAIDRVENTVSDCEVQFGTGMFLPAQEKMACTANRLSCFYVRISKHGGSIHGKQTQQPYDAGDNAYYNVYLTQLDGQFKSAKTREEVARLKLVGLFLFPEHILIEKGVLSTQTQRGKRTLYVRFPDQYVTKLGWKKQKCKTEFDWTKEYFHLI